MVNWQTNVPLNTMTTMGVGGSATYFYEFSNAHDLVEAIVQAKSKGLDFFLLGAGSNLVISDNGISGLVLRSRGTNIEHQPTLQGHTIIAEAGVQWDSLVLTSVEQGLTGIECMSGIPGTVGAAPIQNIGAYGQELCESLQWIDALDSHDHSVVRINNIDCAFSYRNSRFKAQSLMNQRYIILRVAIKLNIDRAPVIKYPELEKTLRQNREWIEGDLHAKVNAVRSTVLSIRKTKSMVLDSADPNTRSCGSFFTNPIVKIEDAQEIQQRAKCLGFSDIPQFAADEGFVKLSAARIVEYAGYQRGFAKGQAGLSSNHSLAIVATGQCASDVHRLAHQIQKDAQSKLGVRLEFEPSFVGLF